jgi:excisionase family DNA binding protein
MSFVPPEPSCHNVDEPGPVLNVPEIAALLRVPRSAIYALVARNQIPHARLGKHLRFHRAEVVRAFFACGPQVAQGKQ